MGYMIHVFYLLFQTCFCVKVGVQRCLAHPELDIEQTSDVGKAPPVWSIVSDGISQTGMWFWNAPSLSSYSSFKECDGISRSWKDNA